MHLVGFIIRTYYDARSPERQNETEHLVRPGENESMNCRSSSTTKFTQPVHSRDGKEETYFFFHIPPVTQAGRRSTFQTAASTTADCAKSCL